MSCLASNYNAFENDTLHDYEASERINTYTDIIVFKNGVEVYRSNSHGSDDFAIASVTKLITATSTLRILNKNQIDVDSKVGELWGEFPQSLKQITIGQLFSHTSGLNDLPIGFEGMAREEVLNAISKEPLAFEPGESWHYSNAGYYILGLLIEELSGVSWEKFVTSEILRPLGMNDTHFSSDALSGWTIEGHNITRSEPFDIKSSYSAGSIVSTVDDLSIFISALLEGRIIPEDDFSKMTSNHSPNGFIEFGYGVNISKSENSVILGHDGWLPGFTSSVKFDKDGKCVVVILSRLDSVRPGELSNDLIDKCLGVETKKLNMKEHQGLSPHLFLSSYKLVPLPKEVEDILGAELVSQISEMIISKNGKSFEVSFNSEGQEPATLKLDTSGRLINGQLDISIEARENYNYVIFKQSGLAIKYQKKAD
nr:serine hydrolase domain-containing protein [Grimontia sedimenti]